MLSGYRYIWIVAMFDLPMHDKALKKAYARFRKSLLQAGFARMQFSVYIRHCASEENVAVHAARIRKAVPDDGEIRLMIVTDKQVERMQVFWGKRRIEPETPPAQLELF
jgi:CRISPR-associated protein Cas2